MANNRDSIDNKEGRDEAARAWREDQETPRVYSDAELMDLADQTQAEDEYEFSRAKWACLVSALIVGTVLDFIANNNTAGI